MSNLDEKNKKRYFNNDIIATAFELFQTNQNFYDALKLLISIVGIRYNLDRVTVGETDLERGVARSLCSWTEGKHISPPSGEHKFSRENFERLFNSYDDNGIAILDSKAIKTYSKDTRIIEIDKNKSVLYSAMYNEGKYVGAVSYVVYSDDKVWAEEEKTDLGELTKVISMYLSKNNQINSCSDVCCNENDIITGLISFHKFKEELEKRIIGGRALSDIVAYFDFEGFNHFNHRYGYNQGDMVLKDFSKIIVDGFKGYPGVFFSRENADKFVLFMPYKGEMLEYKEILEKLFKKFSSGLGEKYKGTHLNIRCGIYRIDDKCKSASIAIMSIVGPRPERRKFVEEFEKEIMDYDKRFFVKAGITGMSHVYARYDTGAKDRALFDILYIRDYSFMLDLKLILLTLKIMFMKNAAAGVKDNEYRSYDRRMETPEQRGIYGDVFVHKDGNTKEDERVK